MPSRSRRATTLSSAVLDQEAVGGVGQGAHQLELVGGEAEALDIVLRRAPSGWA